MTVKELKEKLDKLAEAMEKEDDALAKKALKECVPTYVNGFKVNGGGHKNIEPK